MQHDSPPYLFDGADSFAECVGLWSTVERSLGVASVPVNVVSVNSARLHTLQDEQMLLGRPASRTPTELARMCTQENRN
jgi:hypothetical protein